MARPTKASVHTLLKSASDDARPDCVSICPDNQPAAWRAAARRRLLQGACGLAAALLAGCMRATDPGRPARVRVVAVTAPRTPWHTMWVRFAERAAREAAADLDVQLFVQSQLGSEEVTLSHLRRGRVEMGGYSLQGSASVVPELNVLMAPFLFDSVDEIEHVLDAHLTPLFDRLLAARGLKLIQWAEVGWVHLYGRRALATPADAAGIKLRASTALGQRAFAAATGMDAVSIPFTDVVPALQTGMIAGGQSGTGMYALAGLAREAPVLTRTYHAFDTGLVVANLRWWEALGDARRARVRACLDDAASHRREVRAMLAEIETGRLPELGVTQVELTPAQRAAWRAAAAPALERILAASGDQAQAVYAAIVAGKREFAARRAQAAGA